MDSVTRLYDVTVMTVVFSATRKYNLRYGKTIIFKYLSRKTTQLDSFSGPCMTSDFKDEQNVI
jgi:hypothetical protein